MRDLSIVLKTIGASKVNKELGNLTKSLKKGKAASLAKTKALMGIAGAVIGVVAGLAKLTSNFAKSTEAMGQQASAMGLSIEQYQDLKRASDEYGFSIKDVEYGMRRLAQEAQKKGDFRDRNELFRETAELIKNAATEEDRLRIATEKLGRQGPQMVEFLKNGKEGLDAFSEANERGRRTTEDLERALAFQDIANQITRTFDHLTNVVFRNLLDPISDLFERSLGWLETIEPYLNMIFEDISTWLDLFNVYIDLYLEQLEILMPLLKFIWNIIDFIMKAVLVGIIKIFELNKKIRNHVIDFLKNTLSPMWDIVQKIINGLKTVGRLLRRVKVQMDESVAEMIVKKDDVSTPKVTRELGNQLVPVVAGTERRTGGRGGSGSATGNPVVTQLIFIKDEFVAFVRRFFQLADNIYGIGGGRSIGGAQRRFEEQTYNITVNATGTGSAEIGAEIRTIIENIQSNQVRAIQAIDTHRETVEGLRERRPDPKQTSSLRTRPGISPSNLATT